MILERCQTLSARIAEKKRLEQSVTQIRRYRKVQDAITQHKVLFTPLHGVATALREAGIQTGEVPAGIAPALAAVAAARGTFLQSAGSIIDPAAFAAAPFAQSLTSAAVELEAALLAAWQRHVATKVPPANRDVLDALASAFPREVRTIRQGGERVDRLRQILPDSAEQVREMEREAAVLQQAWGQLGGGEVPAPVLAFLKAAASPAGAGLDLLTEGVRSWLEEHKIVRSFAIRVAGSV